MYDGGALFHALCGLQADLRRRQRLAQLVVKFPRQLPSLVFLDLEETARKHVQLFVRLPQCLLSLLTLGALSDGIGHRRERLESVRPEPLTREHCEHANQTALDHQGIAGQSNDPLLFRPLGMLCAWVVHEIVCDIRFAFLCDAAYVEFANIRAYSPFKPVY